MTVTKDWIEAKVQELNDWIRIHENTNHPQLNEKIQNRNYYVSKLVEMDELELENITI
ncbi:hypothetical protein INQ45_01655 [Flavobacterium columnare]|uniref:hypothetical protein n=1 Tax=Flavobacterium columnare TaxID=996 RepID=UPI002D202737|nr:hypothetical protein [Flavobacterium columnare]MEB3799832.1 hypothetical protein [Flavobacterium columnare]